MTHLCFEDYPGEPSSRDCIYCPMTWRDIPPGDDVIYSTEVYEWDSDANECKFTRDTSDICPLCLESLLHSFT